MTEDTSPIPDVPIHDDASADTADAPPAAAFTPSPATSETPERLLVGILGAPHGIHGDMRVRLVTDFPERLPDITHVYIGDEPERRRLRTLRPGTENGAIIHLAGITVREEAAMFRGQPLYIDIRDAKPLDEDEFYCHQLIDMQVVNPEGELLGTLTSIMQTGANDVYIVTQPDGKELALPAIKDVVLKIDVPHKQMVAKPLEYL